MRETRWLLPRRRAAALSAGLFFCLAAWGCRSPGRKASATDEGSLSGLEEKVCAGLDNSYQCSQAVEKARMPGLSASVVREGQALKIRTSSGTWVELHDSGAEGAEDHAAYNLAGFMAGIAEYLVHVQYFEGDAYLLVDARTGRQTPLDSVPAPSPDRTRLATASFDLEAQYNPNRVRILKAAPDGWRTEFSLEPTDWGPSEPPVWLDEKTLRLVKCLRPCSGESHRTEAALLRLTPEGWRLAEAAGP